MVRSTNVTHSTSTYGGRLSTPSTADLNDAVASKEATHANTLANARATERAEELVHMVQSSDVPVDLGVVRERYEAEQAHHAAFSEKRHQHYGNEAAALKRRPPPEEEEEEDEA